MRYLTDVQTPTLRGHVLAYVAERRPRDDRSVEFEEKGELAAPRESFRKAVQGWAQHHVKRSRRGFSRPARTIGAAAAFRGSRYSDMVGSFRWTHPDAVK